MTVLSAELIRLPVKRQKNYQRFVSGTLLLTNARTAEMSKLVENAYRDVNIAFANELSLICDNQQIDVWELIKLANHHPRVNIYNPARLRRALYRR